MRHDPVMLGEVLDRLRPAPGHHVIDCTAGCGGHAEEILKRIGPAGKLVAIDRDPDAILACRERLGSAGGALTLVCENHRNVERIRNRLGLGGVDAVLIDCGISSAQLEDPARGFSFHSEGPLDMRMDPTQGLMLSDFLRDTAESGLADTIFELGEERYARRIARAIKARIKSGGIRNTRELAELVARAVPPGYRHGRLNPATRTFQALRIRVNEELESLKEALSGAIACLRPGGRLAVIAFHSLEDGLVKRLFREARRAGIGEALTKKPLRPSEAEVAANPRARSARLRIFEKRRII